MCTCNCTFFPGIPTPIPSFLSEESLFFKQEGSGNDIRKSLKQYLRMHMHIHTQYCTQNSVLVTTSVADPSRTSKGKVNKHIPPLKKCPYKPMYACLEVSLIESNGAYFNISMLAMNHMSFSLSLLWLSCNSPAK